jgi:site-specific DNA-methyltransferase (adenine-specific)
MSSQPRAGRVRIYRSTADRLLAALPDGSIDVLLTDPPYATIDRHSTSGHLRDWFAGSQSWAAIGRTLAIGRRKLKPTGVALVMSNAAGLEGALAAMKRAGFADVRPITWDRQWPGLGGGLRHQTEFILLGRLPGSRPIGGTDLVSVSAVGPGTADRYPTEKPVELGRVIARMVGIRPGDLVVDPYCGSGALLVGPAERGATVVAGDISPRAVRRTTERLRGTISATPEGHRAKPTAAGLRLTGQASAAGKAGSPRAASTPRRQPPGPRERNGSPPRLPGRATGRRRKGTTR